MANVDFTPHSKLMPNPIHTFPTYTDENKTAVYSIIEINSHTINKYEVINNTGHILLDRVGYSSLAYNVTYGAIPQTWDEDGDALDLLVAMVTEPLVPGCIAEARIIGVMKFIDGDEVDDKIITVLAGDKRCDHIKSYTDLGEHWQKETTYYFEHYKDLKKPGTCKVLGYYDVAEAVNVIDHAQKRYQEKFAAVFS